MNNVLRWLRYTFIGAEKPPSLEEAHYPRDDKGAPDLTHFGSRRTIAAGALPNTLGHLEGWIANAQAIKPGALMPPITQLTGRELRAVATYVAGLR